MVPFTTIEQVPAFELDGKVFGMSGTSVCLGTLNGWASRSKKNKKKMLLEKQLRFKSVHIYIISKFHSLLLSMLIVHNIPFYEIYLYIYLHTFFARVFCILLLYSLSWFFFISSLQQNSFQRTSWLHLFFIFNINVVNNF